MSERRIRTTLTEEQFAAVWSVYPDDPRLIATAASEAMRRISVPNPRGTLDGRRVYLDQAGVYSTGYVCFEQGHEYVEDRETFDRIVWDSDPTRERLLDVRRKLSALAD